MDIQQKQQEVEQELLTVIINNLKNNQMDVATASRLAKDFLAVLPIKNQEDLLMKLKNLGDKYTAAQQIYNLELGKNIHEKQQQTVQLISNSIREGNIEHAITLAKSLKNQPT
ncbi:MAG: hypothetical protein KatS3mg089_0287 [Patescibacteria group bacterium]|nr:MAG: hypothetical protein KatS3mg089_0287 [Patescibacteria group bacterium]